MKGGKCTMYTVAAVAIGAGVYLYTQKNVKSASSRIKAAKGVESGVSTPAGNATAVADTVGKAISK